jgi:hypothetical protein
MHKVHEIVVTVKSISRLLLTVNSAQNDSLKLFLSFLQEMSVGKAAHTIHRT